MTQSDDLIAVVGMAARMPGACNLEQFWTNLVEARDCIADLTPEEARAHGESADRLKHPSYVLRRPLIPEMESFDARYFGMTQRETQIRDPQQRIFLETCHAVLEHAGYDYSQIDKSIGVFAGTNANRYVDLHLRADTDLAAAVGEFAIETSNNPDYLSTFVAYKLGLRGPAITIATACSTSLVCIHAAGEALRSGACDMAIAGGVEIEWPYGVGYVYTPGGIYSPDGRCRPFDVRAAGTVFGSGTGAVLLKRLVDAVADHDTVYAVVRGSAVNNDGSDKVAFSAPSVGGQAACIAEALVSAGVNPESISYVETHGTATSVGDPIEVEALSRAFRLAAEGPIDAGFCGIGSVKSNVGHLGPAAGVAGFIKAVLALDRELIPPSIHFEEPNPALNLCESPFRVVSEREEWPRILGAPRRAGVSSFGIGGTNAHVVLEEAPSRDSTADDTAGPQLVVWSGADGGVTQQIGEDLGKYISWRDCELRDVAHTLRVGRRSHAHRAYAVVRSTTEAASALVSESPPTSELAAPAVFVFPGQGSQRAMMAHGLYGQSATFRQSVDASLAILSDLLGTNLGRIWLDATDDSELVDTRIAQPLLYAIECGVVSVLRELGIEPDACIGHSLGEIAAATCAGVFSQEDGLRLVAERTSLMAQMPPGKMIAVAAAADEVEPYLGGDVCVAAVNSPRQVVLAGPSAEVMATSTRLDGAGIASRELSTSHAFHSNLMQEAADGLHTALAGMSMTEPTVPFYSGARGARVTDECTKPAFWANQVATTVRFSDAAQELLSSGVGCVLETGPGRSIAQLLRQCGSGLGQISRTLIPTDVPADAQWEHFLKLIGELWAGGLEVAWPESWRSGGRRIGLPTYAFRRDRHFVELPSLGGLPKVGRHQRDVDEGGLEPSGLSGQADRDNDSDAASDADDAEASRRQGFGLARVSWSRVLAPPVPSMLSRRESALLLLPSERQAAQRALDVVQLGGYRPLRVGLPDSEVPTDADADLTNRDAVFAMVEELAKLGSLPSTVVHALTLSGAGSHEEEMNRGLWSLTWLLQAVQRFRADAKLSRWRLVVLTAEACNVSGEEASIPERWMLSGLLRTAALEIPTLDVQLLDLGSRTHLDVAAAQLRSLSTDVVALRANQSFVPTTEPVLHNRTDGHSLRRGGVYVITGGCGALGQAVSRALAGSGLRPRLALLGRHAEPPDGSPEALEVSSVCAELKSLGAEAVTIAADVGSKQSMTEAIQRVHDCFGRVNGVFHLAGVAGGGLLEVRAESDARNVLRPKVDGSLVLADLLEAESDLDFVVYFSSRAALMGLVGSADYAAANAFMDALASAQGRGDRHVVSVLWPGWADAGMAAEQDRRVSQPESDVSTVVVSTSLTGEEWYLEDHRIQGHKMMPGAAFVDHILSAARNAGMPDAVEIKNAVFLAPLIVSQAVELRLRMVPASDGFDVAIDSRLGESWQTHCTATVRPSRRPAETIPLDELFSRLDGGSPVSRDGMVDFGPRWDNVRSHVSTDDGDAILALELPDEFADDLKVHPAHPALLDRCTASIPRDDEGQLFLPFVYESATFFADLPGQVFALIRPRESRSGTLVADVSIVDIRGRVLARVDKFTMRQTSEVVAPRLDHPALVPELDQPGPGIPSAGSDGTQRPTGTLLAPAQGADLLMDVLRFDGGANVVVEPAEEGEAAPPRRSEAHSPTIAQDGHRAQPSVESVHANESTPEVERPLNGAARPTVKPGAATIGKFESRLADLWTDVLGESEFSLDDDFFDIGGTSLSGVQLVARIRDVFGIEIGIGLLFEMSTIRLMAAELRRHDSAA